ncbi:GNAT family N-acetyltransferase [Kordia sp.]|uniref:GNAT family N-acetyltransferase n=1 Tax=Kordia sp. TaxID=1965332 RepID=UPI003B599CF8
MVRIQKATVQDVNAIAQIGSTTFLETYLENTPKEAVESFVATTFTVDMLTADFHHENNHYFMIFLDDTLVGYSKIVLNVANETIEGTQLTKLDRLYVLKEFHGQKLGAQLFHYTIQFSKEQQQHGIWLYVLIENERALNFYKRNDFKITGEYNFKVSETRYNPNYIMYLAY